jgi:hypothetical protein
MIERRVIAYRLGRTVIRHARKPRSDRAFAAIGERNRERQDLVIESDALHQLDTSIVVMV